MLKHLDISKSVDETEDNLPEEDFRAVLQAELLAAVKAEVQ